MRPILLEMTKRCIWLTAVLMGLVTLTTACTPDTSTDTATDKSTQTQDTRPNILFIMSDDHSERAISAYGSTLITTPNIDRIADEGVIFTESFVANSISGPSRAIMLTGKHSH